MEWIEEIEIEDLAEGDSRLVLEYCGEEILKRLLVHFSGMNIYISKRLLIEAKKRFIKRHRDISPKRLALLLDTSEGFIRKVLNDRDQS